MKKVHDIIRFTVDSPLVKLPSEFGNQTRLQSPKPWFPVAFIQYGNEEEGFSYEGVCPYCSASIGLVEPKGDMKERNKALAKMMAAHYQKGCTRAGSSTFDVEKTNLPLGTEIPLRIQ